MDSSLFLNRAVKEFSGCMSMSFSNRYMNHKRYLSLRRAFRNFLKERGNNVSLNILETATNNGWLVFKLREEFSSVADLKFCGVDLSQLDIDFANERKKYLDCRDCDFRAMDVTKMDFPADSFDLVISSELIEHIAEPILFLKEAVRVLKNKGRLVITTPNKGGSIFAKLAGIFTFRKNARDSGEVLISGVGNAHVSVHSRREWIEIFRQAGLRVKSSKGTGGLFFGSKELDKHRLIFALSVIFDVILERLPFSYIWSELLIFELDK